MKLELWHLKISLVEFQGHALVRATHIRGDKLWNNLPYKDFDPKNSLENENAKRSVLDFTRSFDFNFPLPVGPRTWGKIIALADFPNLEEWEKLHVHYQREAHQDDLSTFWRHRMLGLRRTHEVLFLGLRRTTARLLAGIGPLGSTITSQNQAVYARSVIHTYREDLLRLDEFWGTKVPTPEAEKALQVLHNLVSAYTPEKKQNKKKELAATREIAPAKKKGRKAKHVEGQESLW